MYSRFRDSVRLPANRTGLFWNEPGRDTQRGTAKLTDRLPGSTGIPGGGLCSRRPVGGHLPLQPGKCPAYRTRRRWLGQALWDPLSEIARPLAGESRHIRGNSDSPDDDGRTPGEVLQTRAGHVIGDKSPVAVEGVIDNVLRSRRHILDSSGLRLRKLSSRIFPRSSRMRPH
jgi:hypothetical protein